MLKYIVKPWFGAVLALSMFTCVACLVTGPTDNVASKATGTFRTTNLIVDDTTKIGGIIDACTTPTSGCSGKPNFEFTPTTGHAQVIGTGANFGTIRALFDAKETLDGTATVPQQLVQFILDGASTASSGSNFGLESTVNVTNSSGARNIAFLVGAQGSTAGNVAIESSNGDWLQEDAVATFTNSGHSILHDLTAPVSAGIYNFSQSSSVVLGNNVAAPVLMPGDSVQGPLLGLGQASASGEQLVTRNTVTGAFGTRGGIAIGLDTTVDAGARGGVSITRAAGGGFGTSEKGLWVSYGNDTTTYQTANDMIMRNDEVNKSIFFVTGGTGQAHTPLTLRGASAHWNADGPAVTPFSCGTGASITGTDAAFRITAGTTTGGGCTAIFATDYATAPPSCIIYPENGTLPVCQVFSSAIICASGIADGAIYNVHCIGTTSQDQ